MGEATTTEPLLRLATAAQWRAALGVGSVAPDGIGAGGFVHLSTRELVATPANARYRGCPDLLLLVVDPRSLSADDLRWEAPDPRPDDWDGTPLFPHLYAPMPVDAVIEVRPYEPLDGAFPQPAALPGRDDVAARVRLADHHKAVRRAAVRVPLDVEVDGGTVRVGSATIDPRLPDSYEHNALRLHTTVDADTAEAMAGAVFAGVASTHQRVAIDTADGRELAEALGARGWEVQRLDLLARRLDADAARPLGSLPRDGTGVRELSRTEADAFVGAMWDETPIPLTGPQREQLVVRESLDQARVLPVDLGVVVDGQVVAGARLEIDGATAELTTVHTLAAHRGRGHQRAVVDAACGLAASRGCDVLWVLADADDWPRQWYARLGFEDLGEPRWDAERDVAVDEPR